MTASCLVRGDVCSEGARIRGKMIDLTGENVLLIDVSVQHEGRTNCVISCLSYRTREKDAKHNLPSKAVQDFDLTRCIHVLGA